MFSWPCSNYRFMILLAAVASPWSSNAAGAEDEPDGTWPVKYVVEYPRAERCCPPIRSTFHEVTRNFVVVNGHRFRQQINGGYGLPIIDKVDRKNLLHVGADLGWHQVGEPVFAVADGVVRKSFGPRFSVDEGKEKPRSGSMSWGNFVAIEHRFGDDEYYTTLYGHLATERLVKVGDIVRVGQPIGEIGRQHARINGGYTPHVHFGVRQGRIAEIDMEIARLQIDGRDAVISLAALGEEEIEVRLPEGAPPQVRLQINGRTFDIITNDGVSRAPASLLWMADRPDFGLTGYNLTTDGWLDPVGFLRSHQAHAFR